MLPLRMRSMFAAVPLLLVFHGPAPAVTKDVSMFDSVFSPGTVTLAMGDTVRWTNLGMATHTSTDDGIDACCPGGPGLWDSGMLAPDAVYSFTFDLAGLFPYHCTLHAGMKGTVSVGMRAKPTSGGTSTVFTIRWGVGSIPAGFNVDVQILRPGGPGFVDWKIDQTRKLKAMFVPDAGPGTYRFHTRVQRGIDPAAVTLYAGTVSITVTAT